MNILNSDNRLVVKAEVVQYQPANFESLLDRFVNFLEVSSSSVHTYTFGVKRFLQYLSDNRIVQPKRETVLMYKRELIEKHCKPSTIALYLSSIRRFFTWLESEGIYSNITAGVKSPKQDAGHKKDAFSAEQLAGILQGMSRNTLQDKRNYAMFALITACGLRTCEIVRANVGDIRNVMGTPCLFIQGKGKTSKSDFVKLAPQVLAAIREYLALRGQVREDEPLFVSHAQRNNGGRLTTRTVSGACKSAMKKAGYNSSRLTAHSLRHSAITLALLNGQTLEDVQHFARHSNIATTTIYSHAVNRLKSACESVIAGAIFSMAV